MQGKLCKQPSEQLHLMEPCARRVAKASKAAARHSRATQEKSEAWLLAPLTTRSPIISAVR